MTEPLTLQAYQAAVDGWIQEIGKGYFKPLTQLGVMVEEVGEISRILIRSDGEQSWKKGTEPADITAELAAEMADVIFCLACLANTKGIDLAEALQTNMLKKGIRDKERHANNQKLAS